MDSDSELQKDPKERIARASQKEVSAATPLESPSGPSTTDENQNLDLEKLKAEVAGLKASQGRLSDIHKARLVGLGALFFVVVAWLGAILRLVHLSGTENELGDLKLHLPEPVVLALIGTTTVNVLALFVIAAKWLYPSGKTTAD
jgi:hypothetical protein